MNTRTKSEPLTLEACKGVGDDESTADIVGHIAEIDVFLNPGDN